MRNILILFLAGLVALPVHAQGLVINEFMTGNIWTIPDEEEDYPDWIEIYNPSDDFINLDGFGLSDSETNLFKWTFPSIIIPPDGFLLVFASGKDQADVYIHTNFKLKNDGEILTLSSPTGEVLDQLQTGDIPGDISRGRMAFDDPVLFYFTEPTPGTENTHPGYLSISSPPDFSPERCFFSGSISVTLAAAAGAEIRYTLDGNLPDSSSALYTDPLIIDQTTPVSARAFEAGKLYSEVVTHSFIDYQNHDLAVISLTTAPDNLWDDAIGIYTPGPDPGSPPWYWGANYWEDWERPIHIEFFEPEGYPGFNQMVGIKIVGAGSRPYPQKSLALFARDKYGDNDLDYVLFPDRTLDRFESILLRNSGNDWALTMLRDALMTGLVCDLELDIQAYRPAVVFLNGEFWGIHNIREKVNEDFLAENHEVGSNSIDLLEKDQEVLNGSGSHYAAMLAYIENNGLSEDVHYQYIQTQMDVMNFLYYQAAEIYFSNTDWPGNNVKYWRSDELDGRWRWILFDTDFGFGLSPNGYDHNTLAWATDPEGEWANAPWSTYLLRSLLENDSFRIDFIRHFADLLNLNFSPAVVADAIDSLSTQITGVIPDHQVRWERTTEEWYDALEMLYEFAENRADCVRAHIEQQFDLSGTINLELTIDPADAGDVLVNTHAIPTASWDGVYFMDIPITLEANPRYGFDFEGWSGSIGSANCTLAVTPVNDVTLTASFRQISDDLHPVVMTEINYNSASDFNPGDWIEIYNRSNQPVDLSGWEFSDADDSHAFVFPDGITLEVDSLLVICRDSTAFVSCYPEVKNVIGSFAFGLSGDGELLRILEPQGCCIDRFCYETEGPWPVGPDGGGHTLELIDPYADNELASSWRSSKLLHGTPGRYNGFAGWNDLPIPTELKLYPCYPNPFNDQAILRIEVPERTPVILRIFNILGQTVLTPLDRTVEHGFHRVTIDGSGLSSGLYLVELDYPSGRQLIKIALLK